MKFGLGVTESIHDFVCVVFVFEDGFHQEVVTEIGRANWCSKYTESISDFVWDQTARLGFRVR